MQVDQSWNGIGAFSIENLFSRKIRFGFIGVDSFDPVLIQYQTALYKFLIGCINFYIINDHVVIPPVFYL